MCGAGTKNVTQRVIRQGGGGQHRLHPLGELVGEAACETCPPVNSSEYEAEEEDRDPLGAGD